MKKFEVIENFYTDTQLGQLYFLSKTLPFDATYQPRGIYYPNRMKAYPCYETRPFEPGSEPYKWLYDNLTKQNLKIKNLRTFIRKAIWSEVSKCPEMKYGQIPHQDVDVDVAGVIYYNDYSLENGTRLYSYQFQVEPDILIGSKPNRCVFYDAKTWHSVGYDPACEERIIQPFFITLDDV